MKGEAAHVRASARAPPLPARPTDVPITGKPMSGVTWIGSSTNERARTAGRASRWYGRAGR